MSWKMFLQIVLLIIISAVVMLGSKYALHKGKRGLRGRMPRIQEEQLR